MTALIEELRSEIKRLHSEIAELALENDMLKRLLKQDKHQPIKTGADMAKILYGNLPSNVPVPNPNADVVQPFPNGRY